VGQILKNVAMRTETIVRLSRRSSPLSEIAIIDRVLKFPVDPRRRSERKQKVEKWKKKKKKKKKKRRK